MVFDKKENHRLRTSSNGATQTLLMVSEFFPYIKILQETLKKPNIAVRTSSTWWGYTLYSGSVSIDQFITTPWSFDDSRAFVKKHRGNSILLSKTWDIPEARIKNYLCHSEPSLCDRKAYSEDRAEYLECEQYWDFLTALGGIEPQTELHQLNLNDQKNA